MSYIIITDDLKLRQEWLTKFKHLIPEIAFYGVPDQVIPTELTDGIVVENTVLSNSMINNMKPANGFIAKSAHQVEDFLKTLDAKKSLNMKAMKFFR